MKGVIHISQSFRTRASPSDSLVSYPGHLLGSYRSAEIHSVYSIPPADWAGFYENYIKIFFFQTFIQYHVKKQIVYCILILYKRKSYNKNAMCI